MGTESDQYPAHLSSSATSPEIAGAARLYVVGLIPQIFAYAANFPIQKFLQAQSIVAPSAYISAATLAAHVALSWFAVYKLGLGLLGASLILSLSWSVIVLAQFAYIVVSDRCRLTWAGFSSKAFSGLPEFLQLSAASAVMLCLETWYFQVTVLIAGLLKDPEIALDSLAVCMSISGWVFMVSVGFNAAARAAAFSVKVVTSLSLIVAAIIAAIVMCLREYLSYVFTQGEEVARAVSSMTPLLAVTIVLNGIQPVLSGVAVGCGWQAFVAYGIYGGMIVGLFVQTLILVYVTFRTDWNREVREAKKRLNKWGDIAKPLLANED
uniref:Protein DETOXIFICATION n=1 Tax=Oryza glumipatula TaxID=40148 RepID=A0A0D9Z9Q8_9ORYZ